MSCQQSHIQSLIKWAKESHTFLHSNIQIFQDPITGLSFKALKEIPPRTKLVACSYQATLSYLNAIQASPQFQSHASQPFPSEFLEALSPDDPNIIGHFFLIQQYLMGEKSFWWNYIRLLPQPYEWERLALPIWWPDADREFLNGTNAEPPILKRQRLWKDEWSRGVSLLKGRFENWEDYMYNLYQWAATIFGTRSFRASLTIPEEIIGDEQNCFLNKKSISNSIERDLFSVLFPVLDIGNHDGVNRVDWTKHLETKSFNLSTRFPVEEGSQIFNHYGNKSNSELLVGYGFILPNLDLDVVNLKLTPSTEAARLRRSQTSHVVPNPSQPEEEFMFKVQRQNTAGKSNLNFAELQYFSRGLFDTVVCMVANEREARFISEHPNYCLANDGCVFQGPLCRAILQALHILSQKLNYEIQRIEQTGVLLGQPQNNNQALALEYRNRQLNVLVSALTPILIRIESASSFSTLCHHDSHNPPLANTENYLRQMNEEVELLSLECAYDWLLTHYPEIYHSVVKIISEDQEEPLPLDWAVLVEDWDHTYWIVWVYIVWMLWAREGETFRVRYENLSNWLIVMNAAYDHHLTPTDQIGTLYASPSEYDTINHTIHSINRLPEFHTVQKWLDSEPADILKNFASFVTNQETIPAHFKMETAGRAMVEQKMLVVSRTSRQVLGGGDDRPWTRILRGKPGAFDENRE